MRYADLTDPAAVTELVATVKPAAIIHLAAVIPPFIYLRRELAYRVNVEATGHLLAAAAREPDRARFVLASSIAVYGCRNPHSVSGVLTAETPTRPADVYGDHKVRAEQLVRDSALQWVILRLGGVLTVDPGPYVNLDNLYFEQLLPPTAGCRPWTYETSPRRVWRPPPRPWSAKPCWSAATTPTGSCRTMWPRRWRRPWVWSTGCLRACPATPTTMTGGSTPTGWTADGPRRRWTSSTTPGRRCWPRSPPKPA